MEAEILRRASENGIWAVGCVALIFYILKNQEKRDARQEEREFKYQEIIQQLTIELNILKDLNDDFKELKIFIKENIMSEKKEKDYE